MERKRVLVLGATSAIASEVARIHAGRGDRLLLVGRNAAKLEEVARRCAGTDVATRVADFTNHAGNAALVAEAAELLGGIDVALIAHGDLGDQLATEESFEAAESVLEVNFTSVVSLLIPLANLFEAARGGSIAVITSVAGERGRPRNYTYGAAKGALGIYLQGVRSRLYPAGVSVTTLKLGPVDTPMTRDHAKHVLFGKPPAVARDIVRAVDRRVSEAYVPGFWRLVMPVVRLTPEAIFQRLGFLSNR
ncbi:MAG: oxidoreductase, short-chain dehydrogenase/reductase family [Labilithrix sp.]|nr:oxidoreductase, short-chain dehydrogenase/reductase family [Labilithrix sp.]